MTAHSTIPADIVLDFSARLAKEDGALVGRFRRQTAADKDSSNIATSDATITTSNPNPNSFIIGEHVSRGSLADVYRGTLVETETNSESKRPLVVKVAVGMEGVDNLNHETIMYQHSPKLQGTVIPKFYGYYRNEQGTAAFILLEDCGRPYDLPLQSLRDDTKLAIMRALKKVHDAGLEHGDLETWNLLDCNGSPRIVDWHLGLIHYCPARRLAMTEEFCTREAIQELACEEIISVGERMMFRSHDEILYSPNNS